jgi:cytochrome c-type biogenesis protein CcmH
MTRIAPIVGFLLAAAAANAASAQSATEPAVFAYTQLPDAAQEAKAARLMGELRCLVCQGQSIADSDAALAGDMRALVRRRIAAGEAPDDVREWLIARYGRWVTYDPPMDRLTWPLWVLPALLLVLGAWLARTQLRSRR